MFLKLLKKDYVLLKLELLTMLVHKYGKISLMIKNLISGHLAVYFTNLFVLKFLLKEKIWRHSIKKLLEEFIVEFLHNIQANLAEL